MKTINQKLVFFSVVTSIAALVGCGSDENSNPTVIVRNPNKKITTPSKCKDNEKLNISATWNSLGHQYGFLVKFGFAGQPPIDTIHGDYNTTAYAYAEGKRGRSYLLEVVSQGRNGEGQYKQLSVTIPKCADLAEYKKAHPEYSEPLDFVLVF
jgi:hypothetical protein